MPNRFSSLLLQWYDKARRDLPWRGEEDSYKIWLSEVMLQQTQVDTVIPYYIKWVERFPSIESVALATQDELLKFWEGLGYYSRCRNFHKA
ncbi:MAG: A/G-specific adenine glycosylase, partial [Candidatus Marinimicrobia bacterium]|nr:A/G-specific adenine glycosylase [Candidatus Neomarinimicrobiota bacterium]